MKNQAPAPLLLASASPRRREILTLLGEDFEVEPALSEPPPDPALPLEKAVLAVSVVTVLPLAAAGFYTLIDSGYNFSLLAVSLYLCLLLIFKPK